MNLDEPARFGEVDSRDALADLESIADQWAEAASLEVPPPAGPTAATALVVAGMGGSGIAGDLVAALATGTLDVPVVAHKGYGLPDFVGPGTLVVAVSHSGETAETLDAARTALARGARLVGVGGGGDLATLCAEHVLVSRRTPPRHALPLLAGPVLRVAGLVDDFSDVVAAVRATTAAAGRDAPVETNGAKQLGLRLADGGTPTVLGTQGLGAVAAYRLACQLAENAKVGAVHGQVPEAAHNVVASWAGEAPRGGLVVLRDGAGEPDALAAQADALRALGDECFAWTAEVHPPQGEAPPARLASLVALGDLVSVYTALALGRDPTPIATIDRLKQR